MRAVADTQFEHRVVCGVELDDIDAVAEAVVRLELRLINVREASLFDVVCAAAGRTEFGDLRTRPRRAFAFDGFTEDGIALKEVVVLERNGLVEHLVRIELRAGVFDLHMASCLSSVAGLSGVQLRPVPDLAGD